jgi:ketosteroid isomerase-like protein
LSASGLASLSQAAERSSTADAAVVEAVRLMFAALAADDADGFREVTSPDFYAFDVGKRYTGEDLVDLIKKAHGAGKTYVWSITEPQVRIEGSVAWVTYTNRGSIQDASGRKDVAWLESAVLYRNKDAWRVHFLHSTRMVVE